MNNYQQQQIQIAEESTNINNSQQNQFNIQFEQYQYQYQNKDQTKKQSPATNEQKITISQIINKIQQNLDKKQIKEILKNLSTLLSLNINNVYQFGQLTIKIAMYWQQNPEQALLQFFDYLLMNNITQQNRHLYSKAISIITQTIFNLSLNQIIQSNNNKNAQNINNSVLKKQQIPSKNLIRLWRTYIQILITYSYCCSKINFNQHNYIIYWMIFGLILDGTSANMKFINYANYKHIIQPWYKLVEEADCFAQYFLIPLFHQFSLFVRIFAVKTDSFFLTQSNELLDVSQNYKQLNNCTLLMNFICKLFERSYENSSQFQQKSNSQITNTNIKLKNKKMKLSNYHKLDCLMILMSVLQGKFKRCQNNNKVLQYIATIIIFMLQFQFQQQLQKQNDSQLLFYCGQLVGMLFYKNCDWAIQYCRKQKVLTKILKIYSNSVKKVIKYINKLQEQDIVYRRIVFGYCGILCIQKMETTLQQTIMDLSKDIIQIIQAQHGWKDQEQKDQEVLLQYKYQNNGQEQTSEDNDESWSEQYYNRYYSQYFQQKDQVQQFLKAVWTTKYHSNQDIFNNIIQNFDENQSIMWVTELQRYDNIQRNEQDQLGQNQK